MSKGLVFRVVIDGRGLDLLNAFGKASGQDWAALIGATGRNVFTLAQRIDELASVYLAPADQRLGMLSGEMGGRLTETLIDLVFLARRREGELEPGTRRPITYETSASTTPVIEAFSAFTESLTMSAAASEDDEAPADPT